MNIITQLNNTLQIILPLEGGGVIDVGAVVKLCSRGGPPTGGSCVVKDCEAVQLRSGGAGLANDMGETLLVGIG